MAGKASQKTPLWVKILLLVAFTAFFAFGIGLKIGQHGRQDFTISAQRTKTDMTWEEQDAVEQANRPLSSVFPICINTADAEQLQLLPGIGEVKAQAIVDYRTEHGPFTSVEEMEQVPGIGAQIMEEIAPLICLSQEDG